MAEMTVDSVSVGDTHCLAQCLARLVQPGDVFALEGDLGAGKTTFTQGFARELGIEEHVNSPTFTLIKEYRGRIPLYHMDLYRLQDESEALDLGLGEYFHGEGVCVVEWPDRLGAELPEDALRLSFKVIAPEARRIRISGSSGRGRERVKELSKA